MTGPTVAPVPPVGRRRRAPSGTGAGRGSVPRVLVVGAVLLALGFVLWASSRVIGRGEEQAYASGSAPVSVRVSAGHRYWLAVPGGVRREAALNLQPHSVRCSAAHDGNDLSLRLAAEPTDTKMTDNIASFVAPVTGQVQVTCVGLGAVYVPDANDSAFDVSGALLIATCAVLVLAVGLLLSGIRTVLVRRARVDRFREAERSGTR